MEGKDDRVRATGGIMDFRKLWQDYNRQIVISISLILLAFILTSLGSCEIETSEPPCMIVQPIDWNMKCEQIIKVPIPDALDYYEVKALLYNDANESALMSNVIVKKDTVILNAKGIDLAEYQNDKQYCEIYLVYYN